MTTALDVAGLTVKIQTRSGILHAVRGIDLRIAAGEMVCLVGESGCGKSMTALSLMGLLPPAAQAASMHLRVLGQDVRDAGLQRLRGDRVAMIFQDPMTSLNPTFTIGDQMVEGLLYCRPKSGRATALARAAELLRICGVDDPPHRLRQYPHQLSGGQRQRVMIATALMTEPALLIADEPTTALDVTIQTQILELLRSLQRQFSLGILLVTHDLALVSGFADRVCVMYAGDIVEQAEAGSLFARPMHPYTRALIACRPAPQDPPHTRLGFVPGQVPSLVGPQTGCLFRDRCGLAMDACAGEIPLRTTETGGTYRCIIAPADMPHPVHATAIVHDARAPDAATDAVLELRDVGVDYPTGAGLFARSGTVTALSHASLAVKRGGIFGIVGESGSGKSTMSRVMLGLQRPTSGSVRLLGQPFETYDRRALACAIQPVFQDPASSLNPRRGIGATIRLPLDINRIGMPAERDRQVRAMMDRCGLASRQYEALPSQLSGGQRQRVALASALILRPQLVICDEPTSALDVSIQAQILNLLLELRAEFDLTYVLISHDLDVIRHMADGLAVLRRGEIVEQGVAAEIFASPAHPTTRSLLGERVA